MTLFLDYNLELENERCVCMGWSSSEFQPLLALSTTYPRILFIQEEGIILPELQIAKGKKATTLSWHPVYPQLAIGWDDGVLTLWNEDDRLQREDKMVHKASITAICFSNEGSRMITGDSKGVVSVWRTHNNLIPICQYSSTTPITHLVFSALPFDHDSMEKWNSIFFFGTQGGSVCLADDLKNCSEMCKVGGHIKSLLFYEKDNSLIIITSHLLLVMFKINPNEKLKPNKKLKLSIAGDPEDMETIWAGEGLLATCSGENMIRMTNIESDDNYVLTLADPKFGGQLLGDKIISFDYNRRKRMISCGTQGGFIILWKCKSLTSAAPTSSDAWESNLPIHPSKQPLNSVAWGAGQGLMGSMFPNGVVILNETILKKRMRDGLKIVQSSTKALEIRMKNPQAPNSDFQFIMNLGFNIKGIDCSENHVLVWNGKQIYIYEVNTEKKPSQEGSFDTKATVFGIYEENIVQAVEGRLEVLNLRGTVKQSLPLTESEGEISIIEINKEHMAVATSNNIIKLWDISRRSWKQIGIAIAFQSEEKSLGDIRSLSLNSDGSKLCILAETSPVPSIKIPDTKIYIYDISNGHFLIHEISKQRIPREVVWDQSDPRLFVVELEWGSENNRERDALGEGELEGGLIPPPATSQDRNEGQKVISTMFVTSENGIKEHSIAPLEGGEEGILGLSVPHYYFLGQSAPPEGEEEREEEAPTTLTITRKPMRDFENLESIDEQTRSAILNFSVHLAYGNLDEAYNSVRNIENASVWESMAQMCVKTKRIDVAQICLGNMRFARGAKAVRLACSTEAEPEAQVAMVAIQLNMLEDAKRLYREAGRWDLLTKLLEACGDWEEALRTAREHDMINFGCLNYKIAQYYEYSGELSLAIQHYEDSGTAEREVPRMYWSSGKLEELQAYISTKNSPGLYRWWAQYMESMRNYPQATRYYDLALDYGSLCRLACYQDDINKATQIALESTQPAAFYHLARKTELMGNIRDAIEFYRRSQRLHHAVRLARDNGFDAEVMNMSLQSSRQVKLQSAIYFEEKELWENAATLYYQSGNQKRAMFICKQHKLFEKMKEFAISRGEEDAVGGGVENQEMAQENIEILLREGQYDKAVVLLIRVKEFIQALQICEEQNVMITDEIANKLTPEKEFPDRLDVLTRLARVCKRQGSFALGAKKYTQAGQREKAMKCLLKEGNIKSIINFANTARNVKCFIIAANYLQKSDWHNDTQLMKIIISFYSKAKAFELLSNFYDACGQVEIDEYREYKKALGALTEALKYLKRSNAIQKDNKIQALERKMDIVQKFITAISLKEENPAQMIDICNTLVQMDIENAIRAGDVYAQIIEQYYKKGQMTEAYATLQSMKNRNIILNPYLDQEMVDNINNAMGVKKAEVMVPSRAEEDNEEEDDIGEEIGEDFEY